MDVSVLREGSRVKTGWYGGRPPTDVRSEIRQQFEEGTIGELLSKLTLIPYAL